MRESLGAHKKVKYLKDIIPSVIVYNRSHTDIRYNEPKIAVIIIMEKSVSSQINIALRTIERLFSLQLTSLQWKTRKLIILVHNRLQSLTHN